MSTTRLLARSAALLLCLAACRRQELSSVGQQQEAPVICTSCKSPNTMKFPSIVQNESWPKQCPACQAWSLYPCEKCRHCQAPVALKDDRTKGYGNPQVCASCGKSWEP